ncbi:hypothetical protein LXL04_026929 [Taraxacum kok-saghyz]
MKTKCVAHLESPPTPIIDHQRPQTRNLEIKGIAQQSHKKVTQTTKSHMGSRGTNILLSRASRIKSKLQSVLEARILEVEDVSYQHAGHAAVKDNANETHFNVKVVSGKFDGQNLVKRHRMVYDALSDELESGLHAISIVAKTPKEAGLD